MSGLQLPPLGAAIGWTFCSGIGAPETAAPWVDWRLASEIEDFPREVLRQRFGYKLPEDHNQGEPILCGDFTQITPDFARSRGIPLPDILVAGTPCQAFSMAGLRKGVKDPRGNLTLKFVENVHAIVDARHDGKLTVLWENVYGVLSDKHNAFGCFLGGLVGADGPLCVPGGGSWPSAGMVAGPRARVAWRVFDAQHFGVAQRRRRVFLVADFGGGADPATILFERESLRRGPAPRGGKGQENAGPAAPGAGGGRGARGSDPLAPICMTGERTHALTAEGFDASEGGTGRGTPIVTCPPDLAKCLNAGHSAKNDPTVDTLIPCVVGALSARGRGLSGQDAASGHIVPVPMAFNARQDPDAWEDRTGPLDCLANTQAVAYELRGRDGGAQFEAPNSVAQLRAGQGGSSNSCVLAPPRAFAENSQGEVRFEGGDGSVTGPLSTGGGKPGQSFPAILSGWLVRRLMPVEAHRLQGFPDFHCAIEWRGKPAPDGRQFKALGNSMAVPNVAWIMRRLCASGGWPQS